MNIFQIMHQKEAPPRHSLFHANTHDTRSRYMRSMPSRICARPPRMQHALHVGARKTRGIPRNAIRLARGRHMHAASLDKRDNLEGGFCAPRYYIMYMYVICACVNEAIGISDFWKNRSLRVNLETESLSPSLSSWPVPARF